MTKVWNISDSLESNLLPVPWRCNVFLNFIQTLLNKSLNIIFHINYDFRWSCIIQVHCQRFMCFSSSDFDMIVFFVPLFAFTPIIEFFVEIQILMTYLDIAYMPCYCLLMPFYFSVSNAYVIWIYFKSYKSQIFSEMFAKQ